LADVAVISDVHSNLEALESVLAELGGMQAYCLGDMVGYGANPNEVVELLRKRSVMCILGNHDYAAITADTGLFNPRAAAAAEWTTRELTGINLEYLRALPRQVRVRIGDVDALLTHGSPDDALWEYVHPVTHSQLFGHYLSKYEVGILGLGHTHIPFVWREAEGTVFNPGSVGQPRDGDRRASFAVLTPAENSVWVDVRRVDYDYETAAAKIREAGLPEQNATRLSNGT
jgi:predicted phosphodiesterase